MSNSTNISQTSFQRTDTDNQNDIQETIKHWNNPNKSKQSPVKHSQ